MEYFLKYIEHINLAEVVWPGGMNSVPEPLEEAVLSAVERVAGRNGITLDGTDEAVQAIEFAIEVALDQVGLYLEWAFEDHQYARTAYKEGRIYAAISGYIFDYKPNESDDEPALEALLVYQLDQLVGISHKNNIQQMLRVSADIFEIQNLLGERGKQRDFSNKAAGSARIRHEKTTLMKEQAIAEWLATGGEYESRSDFARIVGTLRGIKYRTLYDWITEHERSEREKEED